MQIMHHSIGTAQHPESELTTSLKKDIINCHHIHCAANLTMQWKGGGHHCVITSALIRLTMQTLVITMSSKDNAGNCNGS